MFASLSAPMKATQKLLDFIGHGETIQDRNAVPIQSELWRKCHRHSIRRSPIDSRAQILRGKVQSESVCITQASVHFDTRLKLLRAKGAFVRAGGKLERAARPECIAALPRIPAKIFLGDEVLADVPAVDIAAQDQFELKLT